MIGVAIASVSEKPFHSMASKKNKVAKRALILIRNRDKVSSFCCDVIGDVCGIISGATGSLIIANIVSSTRADKVLISMIVMGIISSFTIAGKAFEKSIAMSSSTKIIYRFAHIISLFKR